MVRTRFIIGSVAVLLSAALVGCSASGGSSVGEAGWEPSMSDAAAPEAQALDGAELSAVDRSGIAASQQSVDRSIISSGSISIEVDDPKGAAKQVAEIANGLGGHLENQSISGANADSAQLTLRVPSERFEEAFTALGELGEVRDESRSASDVTMEHVDLQARVSALEASVTRLTELMAGAASTSELLEAESALSQRQAELDGLRAQLKQLETQIDEATIWVSLSVKSAALPGGPSNFWEGLLAGLGSVGTAASAAVIVLGVLLPWIVIAAVIAGIAVLLVRRGRSRSARLPQPGAEQAGREAQSGAEPGSREAQRDPQLAETGSEHAPSADTR